MPVYEVKPREGIGPIRLGARRDDVRVAVAEPPDPFQKDALEQYEADAFDSLGLHAHYAGDPPAVEFVEAFHADGVQFVLSGIDLFGQPAASVVATLAERYNVVEEEQGCSFVVPELDVALWRESPDDEVFASIGAGEVGYFGDVAV